MFCEATGSFGILVLPSATHCGAHARHVKFPKIPDYQLVSPACELSESNEGESDA